MPLPLIISVHAYLSSHQLGCRSFGCSVDACDAGGKRLRNRVYRQLRLRTGCGEPYSPKVLYSLGRFSTSHIARLAAALSRPLSVVEVSKDTAEVSVAPG